MSDTRSNVHHNQLAMAAKAIANTDIEHHSLTEDTVAQSGLKVNLPKLAAREKVGLALMRQSTGLAIASNIQMREQIEMATDILMDEIMKRPAEGSPDEVMRLLSMKIHAASGIAIMASKHTELNRALTEMASVKAYVDKFSTQKRVTPQIFLGTNYVQNNAEQQGVAKEDAATDNSNGRTM